MFNCLRKDVNLDKFYEAIQQAKNSDTLYISHMGKVGTQGSFRTYFTLHSTCQNITRSFIEAYTKVYGDRSLNTSPLQEAQVLLSQGKPLTVAVVKNILQSAPTYQDKDNSITTKRLFDKEQLNKDKTAELVIPEGITDLPDYAFLYCKYLTSIKLPSTLKRINSNAFYGCESLEYIMLPNKVSILSQNAFANCKTLKSILLPNALKTLGKKAFCNCNSLISIDLPDTLTKIDLCTFAFCSNLSKVRLPKNLREIHPTAFYECNNLKTIEIPKGLEIDKIKNLAPILKGKNVVYV